MKQTDLFNTHLMRLGETLLLLCQQPFMNLQRLLQCCKLLRVVLDVISYYDVIEHFFEFLVTYDFVELFMTVL